jgi:predicted unusual protein kinase regulating ubiquinone biosynthesis (AarF/ABC1/UbiB family)
MLRLILRRTESSLRYPYRSLTGEAMVNHQNKQSLTSLRTLFKISGVFIVGGITTCLGVKLLADHEKKSLDDSKLPLVYDPFIIDLYWNERKSIVTCRLSEIILKSIPFLSRTISDWGIPLFFQYLTNSPSSLNQNQLEMKQSAWGSMLRDLLVDLGPTFIKFGQMLSIRPDVLPPPVLLELQRLCDGVPPNSTAHAIQLIEKELGRPVSEIFQDLNCDSQPIAAASLGQVYKCKLIEKTSTGQEIVVAVKVQRPDMLNTVSLDLFLLRKYMEHLEALKAILMDYGLIAQRKQFDVNLIDAFASASYLELDYCHEATNQETFLKMIQKNAITRVYIPQVYRQHCSRRVLTTEWINGIQLARSSPEVIRDLVPVGVEFFLTQLLEDGLFHGDPHPGNLLVNEKGQLVLLDFGLCQEISLPNSIGLTAAIVHLIAGDVPALLEDAITLEFLPDDVDRSLILPSLVHIFEKGSSVHVDDPSAHYSTAKRKHQFQALAQELNEIFFKYPFVIPEYFTLLTRSLIVLEGIAVTGDANFDIFHAAYPFAVKLAMKRFGGTDLALIALSLTRNPIQKKKK